jgi:hypothetical protein
VVAPPKPVQLAPAQVPTTTAVTRQAVQRSPNQQAKATSTKATSTKTTDKAADHERTDLDDLARRLLEPVGRLLRAELRQGRERAGLLHDRRH